MALWIHDLEIQKGWPLNLKGVLAVREQLHEQWIWFISFYLGWTCFKLFPPLSLPLLWIHNSSVHCEGRWLSALDLPIQTVTENLAGAQAPCLPVKPWIPVRQVKPRSQAKWRGCLILPWAVCWCFALVQCCREQYRPGAPRFLLAMSKPEHVSGLCFSHWIPTCVYKGVIWFVYQAWPTVKVVS